MLLGQYVLTTIIQPTIFANYSCYTCDLLFTAVALIFFGLRLLELQEYSIEVLFGLYSHLFALLLLLLLFLCLLWYFAHI